MLKSNHLEEIVYYVLYHLPESHEIELYKPILAEAYVKMLWEEALTQQERDFYLSRPGDVDISDNLDLFPYYCSFRDLIFHETTLTEEDCGIAAPEKKVVYKPEGRVNQCEENICYKYDKGWDKFSTSLLDSPDYKGPFVKTDVCPYNGLSLTVPTIFVPRVSIIPSRVDEDGKGCSGAGVPLKFYRVIRDHGLWYLEEMVVEGPMTDNYKKCLCHYVGLGRKAMTKIYELVKFLVLPEISITFLRTNFPELIQDLKFSK